MRPGIEAGLMVLAGAHALDVRPVRVVDSMVNRVSYTLDSSLDSVNQVEAAAEHLARTSGLDEDQTFQLAMAVREAAVNAVLHGNAYDPGKKMTASFENDGSSLIVRITDQGNGLDPATLPDPLAPENLLNGSGRGIFLIRSFMDEVHFKLLHPGTELTLIKHLDSTQKSA
jgi:serine/threonine-protein kinase RsbW